MTMKRLLAALCAALIAAPAFAAPPAIPPSAPQKILNSIDVTKYGVSSSASDNATALQAAINAAIAAKRPLYIPSSGSTCYKYTAPLTINGNLTIYGDSVSGNWNGNINVPAGSPALTGSVLCPSSNGSDAIDITGTTPTVNIQNLGILFQTLFSGTGDGIHFTPSGSTQGLTGSFWNNVYIYGHSGSSYAVNLYNPIVNTFNNVQAVGGGGFNLYGSSGGGNFGNMVLEHPYVQTIVGGTAYGYKITAAGSQNMNLITMVRPQAIVNNVSGVSPGGNIPTSAQYIYYQDGNVQNIRLIAPDFETNVGAPIQVNGASTASDMDWTSLFTTASSINSPNWGVNGLVLSPKTRNYNDSTSSGAATADYLVSFPGWNLTSTNPTTYGVVATLAVAPPIASTNTTITRNDAIYATGEVYTTGDLGSAAGLFTNGTHQLAANSSSYIKMPNLMISGTAATVSGTGLGTGPTVVTNGANAGLITVGTSPTASANFTITLPAATTGWACQAQDETNNATIVIGQTSHTTTTAVMQPYVRSTGATGTMTAADKVSYTCLGY